MDAKELATRLYDHFGSDAKVGKATDVAQSTVNRIRRGLHSPNWATYQAMLAEYNRLQKSAA